MPERVYIVILNWNGWSDTLECLESVFNSDYEDFRVIVCDNDSSDGSVDKIIDWAQGRKEASITNPAMISKPPTRVKKPIPFKRLSRSEAEAGRIQGDEPPLILIDTGANLGFAGGNNVGLRYALARGNFEHVWLLNNDTFIEPDALSTLIRRMRETPTAGVCGSTLIYYHAPDKVQILGGSRYNRWRCRAMPIGAMLPKQAAIDRDAVEAELSYIAGASMLVRKEFLRDIGLMQEDYFLYFEEFDWARRAAGRYSLAYAPESIVYHKEGGSIGTGEVGKRSALSIYYLFKNRSKFVHRFFRMDLPLLYLNITLDLLRVLLRRDFFELKWMMFALLPIKAAQIARTKRAT